MLVQKVGGGSLATNQRLVDLNRVQTDAGQKWTDFLTDLGDDLTHDLAHAGGNERALFQFLAGQRA